MLYRFGHAVFRLYFRILYRWRIEGRENIPDKGPFIICSNHISWIDPPLVGCAIPARLQVHFMAKAELFRNAVIRAVLRGVGAFPVKRDRADHAAIRTSLRLLQEGKVLGLFPEGTRSKTGSLQQAQNGAAMIALRTGAPILPVAIAGPYRLGRPVRLYIGAPFKFTAGENGERRVNLDQSSVAIMESIEALLPKGDNKENQ